MVSDMIADVQEKTKARLQGPKWLGLHFPLLAVHPTTAYELYPFAFDFTLSGSHSLLPLISVPFHLSVPLRLSSIEHRYWECHRIFWSDMSHMDE